jgi:NAD(P)H-nitrite reductase large subunit
MQGLYLLDDSWYEENRITLWLNTHVTGISAADHLVTLGTGEQLTFDRLVLATGSASAVPPVAGFGMQGTFVLREASDAIAIRAYAQQHDVRAAVVLGAGLLGLEAAHALRTLGLGTIVLDRGPRLLGRQIDARASELLSAYFEGLGITVLPGTEAAAILGDGRVNEVELTNGSTVSCGMVLVCAGNAPNTELANDVGVTVNRGVVVDRHLETSQPGIYAVGDCAELEGELPGLWPVAVGHAEIAAANLVGGERVTYDPVPQPVILKGVGLDVVSVGQLDPDPSGSAVTLEDGPFEYRKLVLDAGGRVAGAVVLGRPQDARLAMTAVARGVDVGEVEHALRAGDWSGLETATGAADAMVAEQAG